jgi:hypothetical protein
MHRIEGDVSEPTGETVVVAIIEKGLMVTRPGTPFAVVYEWQPESRQLILSQSWISPHTTSPAIAEFRTAAWDAACKRARELGWID